MLIIFGEAHFKAESVKSITDEIIKRKPKFVLHELIYNGIFTPSEAKRALAHCSGKGICDKDTNSDLFELAVKCDFTLVGCDLSIRDLEKYKNPIDGFRDREEKMVKVMKAYADMNAVAVVGDAHLRTTSGPVGFESLIQKAIKDGALNAIVIRAPKKFREF